MPPILAIITLVIQGETWLTLVQPRPIQRLTQTAIQPLCRPSQTRKNWNLALYCPGGDEAPSGPRPAHR